MKITDVTLTLFAWDDIPPTTYGAHTGRFSGKSALGLLRLMTDEGVEGHAFLGSAMNPATTDGQGLITHLKPVLMGKNPLHREQLNQEIWKRQRSAGVRAIGAADVALWDLIGKAMGQPIHRLLGTYRESVPAYASSAVLASPEAYADQDIYNYTKLKQQLSIPILATEYPITGLDSYQPWIMLQATDYLRGDVAVKGGITTLVKTAHLAEAFRMNYEVHHGGNSLNNVANLHVIAAIRNTEFFEVLLPDAAQKYGLEKDIVVGRDGLVQVPNGPGLGAAIDFGLIERKKVAVLS